MLFTQEISERETECVLDRALLKAHHAKMNGDLAAPDYHRIASKVDSLKKHNVGGVRWNNSVVKSLFLNNSKLKTIVNKYFSKRIIEKMWNVLSHLFKRKVVKMKTSTKEDLISFYKKDIIKLSKLINRDLTLWLR